MPDKKRKKRCHDMSYAVDTRVDNSVKTVLNTKIIEIPNKPKNHNRLKTEIISVILLNRIKIFGYNRIPK